MRAEVGARWLVLAACCCLSSHAQDDNPRRGWHFYENPPPPAAAPPPAPAPVTAPVPAPVPAPAAQPAAPSATDEAFARMQQQLTQARNQAILEPSELNVRRYMMLEMEMVARASRFADVAQRIGWANPALDPRQNDRPPTQIAARVFDHEQDRQRSAVAAGLAKDHVLLFFFRSDCPYCHAYAPVLRRFEQEHGLRVVGVSLDGAGLPEFPTPRPDNGISARLGVTQVPMLFLAHPAKGVITPLGAGVLAGTELLTRVATVGSDGREGGYGAVQGTPLN